MIRMVKRDTRLYPLNSVHPDSRDIESTNSAGLFTYHICEMIHEIVCYVVIRVVSQNSCI